MNLILGISFGSISVTLLILIVLLAISIVFNKEIEKAGNLAEGWSWLLVVIGVAYTLIGIGLLDLVLDWNAGFIGLLAFGVSGFPMAFGGYRRWKDMQTRAQKAIKES